MFLWEGDRKLLNCNVKLACVSIHLSVKHCQISRKNFINKCPGKIKRIARFLASFLGFDRKVFAWFLPFMIHHFETGLSHFLSGGFTLKRSITFQETH